MKDSNVLSTLVVVISICIFISCDGDERQIDFSEWNKNTITFIGEHCDVAIDSMKLGSEPIKSRVSNKIYSRVDEYLEFKFEARRTALSLLSKKEILEVRAAMEIYSRTKTLFIFYLKDQDVKSIEISNSNSNATVVDSTDLNYDSMITNHESVVKCLSDFSVLPTEIWVKTKFQGNEIQTIHVALGR